MLIIKNSRGITLIELVVTISLLSILSIGVVSIYMIGMNQMDRTEIENETMTVYRIIKRELTSTIKEAKNVQWGGSFPLVITLYNDSVIRYRNSSGGGKNVIQKDKNDNNWHEITSTNYVSYQINSINLDATRQTIDINIELNGNYRDLTYSIKRAITNVHWRNQ